MHDADIDKERGAWKNYYLERFKEREDQCEYSLSRMIDWGARENEECKADLKRKHSDALKQCQAEMRHAIPYLAGDTIGSITSTVSRSVRANLRTIMKDQLAARVKDGLLKRPHDDNCLLE